MNNELYKVFVELSNIYDKKGDKHRAKAYLRGAMSILNHKEKIKSGTQALALPGIGNSISEKIDEYLETGTLSIFETLFEEKEEEEKKEDEEKINILMLFKKIHGVGDVMANKWYDDGYRTLKDLEKVKMNRQQKLGYKYFDDLQKRIPREEIEFFETKFEQIFPNVEFKICGSYRRGLDTSSDIDMLICENKKVNIPSIVKKLNKEGILKESLSSGKSKFMGLIMIKDTIRHLDIMIIPLCSWHYATLHFTGSKEHNINMRNQAINKGYTLNEYGLFDEEGNNHIVNSEEEIYELLEVDYVLPIDRN